MTKPTTAILAEDEAPQRQELRALLATLWPQLNVVAECADGLAALEAWSTHRPDIVFLDIRMPGLTGLEVARQAGQPAHLVFLTAYDEFAIKAFDAGAVDYLLKPIRADRLAETISRLRARGPTPQIDVAGILDALASRLAPKAAIRWITAGLGDAVRMIPIDEVVLFQSEDKYTCVVTGTERVHIRTPLKDLEAQLDPEDFWRVHRNAIVRVSAILRVKPDDDGRLVVWLKGVAAPVRVSDAFRQRFKAM